MFSDLLPCLFFHGELPRWLFLHHVELVTILPLPNNDALPVAQFSCFRYVYASFQTLASNPPIHLSKAISVY